MARKNPAAVALGRISTPKKAQAARENGKKGGRPKGEDNRELRAKVEALTGCVRLLLLRADIDQTTRNTVEATLEYCEKAND